MKRKTDGGVRRLEGSVEVMVEGVNAATLSQSVNGLEKKSTQKELMCGSFQGWCFCACVGNVCECVGGGTTPFSGVV